MCNPIAAVIAVASAVQAYQTDKGQKQARNAAAEQQRIAQEAENNRIAEAQAEAERQRQGELRRQQNITQGQNDIASVFGQFDDGFYNKRAQSYLDYALPQLDQQYQDQQRQLTAELARTGNLNSSLRGELMGQLQRQYDTNKLNIQSTANKYAADARSSVDAARARLTEKNTQLADPGTVRTMAEAEASGIGVDPRFESLGQMIASLSGTLPGGAATAGKSGAGVNLYTSDTGSGRVVS